MMIPIIMCIWINSHFPHWLMQWVCYLSCGWRWSVAKKWWWGIISTKKQLGWMENGGIRFPGACGNACRQMVTLLHMLVLYMAFKRSGRCSSLQPLLSSSLALILYLTCSQRRHTHTHTQVMLQGKRRMHKGILQSREWFALISTCQVQIGAINTINYKMKEFLSQ